MRSFKFITLACTSILACAVSFTAHAQNTSPFSSKTIKLVVPWGPGGGIDMMCRVVAEQLSKQFGGTVVVENRSGAAGTIGAAAVARSAPDGTTMLCANNSDITLAQFIVNNSAYVPERDLMPVTMAVRQTPAIVANVDLPLKDGKDLAALAGKQPLAYGHSGIGSNMHLAMELFASEAGLSLNAVPYSTGVPIPQVLSNEVQMTILNLGPLIPHIRAGKLRPLAVFRSERSPALPDVPTVREIVGKDIPAPSWFGFFLPTKTPLDTRNKLDNEIRKALQEPRVRETLAKAEMEIVGMPADEFTEVVAKERKSYAEMLRKLNIKLN